MLEQIELFLGKASGFVWGPPLLILLVGTHLFLTVRLGFIQRHIWKGIKLSFSRKNEGEGDISQFGALMTALAATVGTGNIAGVATAIAAGGPGAALWMWLTGVFGIATKYGEALLSVKYRVTTADGKKAGGPMYVLEHGMGQKWLGVIFAIMTACAAFGIGNMVQANSLADLVQETFGFPRWGTGLIVAALTAMVMIGGIRWIARVCEVLVPFMAVFYILGCLVLLVVGLPTIPATIKLIITSAFTGHAAVGGFMGAAMRNAIRYGVARGLFSNESGLGSAPIVAAAAQTRNPVRQALVSATGTFWDTVVICALTAIVIVNSGEWQSGATGAPLTRLAFARLPYFGPFVLSVGMFTFVFSTILGWSYYGEKAVEYLMGASVAKPYRVLWVICVFIGSVATLKAVWDFADTLNGLMAIPNLISLVALNGIIVGETRKYMGKFDSEAETGDNSV
ncbi:MAG TPA: sodium:alanine symporter family protein [Candidatus Brocadiia bacterium]|nr:sodium:alanine symporter family protein [Candidatus Brocadiia bacterium]